MDRDQRGMTQEKAAQMAEEAAKREEEEREQRKVDSKELAGETIRRELAESAWDVPD
jgi:microfibrillar-associated protein 1